VPIVRIRTIGRRTLFGTPNNIATGLNILSVHANCLTQ
jgi:hypothetical protein